MAILGTGIDIVENYRLKKILLKKKEYVLVYLLNLEFRTSRKLKN